MKWIFLEKYSICKIVITYSMRAEYPYMRTNSQTTESIRHTNQALLLYSVQITVVLSPHGWTNQIIFLYQYQKMVLFFFFSKIIYKPSIRCKTNAPAFIPGMLWLLYTVFIIIITTVLDFKWTKKWRNRNSNTLKY